MRSRCNSHQIKENIVADQPGIPHPPNVQLSTDTVLYVSWLENTPPWTGVQSSNSIDLFLHNEDGANTASCACRTFSVRRKLLTTRWFHDFNTDRSIDHPFFGTDNRHSTKRTVSLPPCPPEEEQSTPQVKSFGCQSRVVFAFSSND